MSTIHDDIAAIRKEIDTKRAEADRLQRFVEAFPGVKKHVGRWNKVAYYSKDVNSKVDRFDLRHNCGCCSDSPLEVWPYLETPHGNVYSDPPMFQIGEAEASYGGDVPYPKWEEKLSQAGIPEIIRGAISMHFKRCAKEALDRAAEVYGEASEDGT